MIALIVDYQGNTRLQRRLDEFLMFNQGNRVGFFDEERMPDALHSTAEHYFADLMRTRGRPTILRT